MLIITPDGGYLHIPHEILLSTPANHLSAQYGIAPEWFTFAQQLSQGDVGELAPQGPRPAAQPARPSRPRLRRRPRKPSDRDHRKRIADREHRR